MTIETVGAIFLGWLLGLLSPAIVSRIQSHYREREIRKSIITELTDLRFRMAGAAWIFEARFGSWDRNFMNWLIPILKNYQGPNNNIELLNSLQKLVVLDDDSLRKMAIHQKARPEGALNVKKYRVPYLDANIGQLGVFSEQSRAAILDVRAQLDIFNEEVDEARLHYKFTFELKDSANHALAVQSVQSCYKNLGQIARHIADRIGKVLE